MLLPWIRKRSFTPTFSFGDGAKSIALILLSIFIFIFFLLSPSLAEKIKMSFYDHFATTIDFINRPFKQVSDEINSISNIAELKAENERLLLENERLKEWYQTALMLRAQNKSLETLLNVKSENNFNFITARVLVYPKNNYRSELLVKIGRESGITKGDIVLSGEGVIGRVHNIGEKVSYILAVTDINSRIPVTVEGTNKNAIAVGQLNQNIILRHYDFNLKDMIGKNIYTSGDGDVFPAGLFVGVVTEENGNFIIEPAADLNDIKFVKIMKSNTIKNINSEEF